MDITIYDAFELNRVLQGLLKQQSSYEIKTAFKLYELTKWLDETERFVFERVTEMGIGMDENNPLFQAMLLSRIEFINTTLTTKELWGNIGKVMLDVQDVEILKKILDKAEN